jgi:polygalacturonase
MFENPGARPIKRIWRFERQSLTKVFRSNMKIPVTLLTLSLGVAFCLADAPPTTGSEPNFFDVRQFGAKGDGQTPDTKAIQKALDECGKAGGGTVKFSPGIYLSQPISIRTRTTVLLDAGAILLASTNQRDFMKTPGDWLKAKSGNDFVPLIAGSDLTDVTITGRGTIDGNGGVWWGEAEKARQKVSGYTLPRPNLIVLTRCQNVRLENLTLQNSPKFHFVPTECEGVVISNVTILAPERAANTDAIDPSSCKNVLITRCRIDVGDDNIAIKAGKKLAAREFASEDITVTDCTFLHGHGMSIGSETAGGVRNLTVSNCTFENTENGLRIKSQRGKGGIVENISYRDITMKNVNPAITLTCYYMNNSSGDTTRPAGAGTHSAPASASNTPVYRNIHISNLKATCPKAAGIITGLPESMISNVVFENVQISAAKSFEIRNAQDIQLKNVAVSVKEGPPFATENAQVEGLESANGKH